MPFTRTIKASLSLLVLISFSSTALAESALPSCAADQNPAFEKCYGTYYFNDGSKYVGENKNGKPHGQGTFTFAKGGKYVGEFKNGQRHGQGTTTFDNGMKYEGEFKDGQRHGQGTTTSTNGMTHVAEYIRGEQHGEEAITWPDGTTLKGFAFHMLEKRLANSRASKILVKNILGEIALNTADTAEEKTRNIPKLEEIFSRCSAVQVTNLSLIGGNSDEAFRVMGKFITLKREHVYTGMMGISERSSIEKSIATHELTVSWYQSLNSDEQFVADDKTVCALLAEKY